MPKVKVTIRSKVKLCLKLCFGVVGWCNGAGQTSSAGASYTLDDRRARAYWA